MKKAVLYYCGDYDFDCNDYKNLLPEERFEKYDRLKPYKSKQNCLGAYLLLRYALKEHGKTDFNLIYSANGKPYLDGGGIFFNLSHSVSGFVCAVDDSEIGADIESVKAIKETAVSRIFSPEEKEFALNSGNPQKAFAALWTLKESSIKKNGETLAQYSKYKFVCPSEDFYLNGCHYKTFFKDDSAISVCGGFEEIKFETVGFQDLL